MGIPNYFSYIIKNYANIIKKFVSASLPIHEFYLDCNSIIYDSYYAIEKKIMADNTKIEKNDFESLLINTVIQKISDYIAMVNPSDLVYIAFDGVAPFAKMEQQRTRRYKSHDILLKTSILDWTTTLITPGTEFMTKLGNSIASHFSKYGEKYKIIISTSSEKGEGEHKLFAHLRRISTTNQKNVIVYGLDSDLIMLSIFHLKFTQNIYIFREAPAFGKEYADKPTEHMLLDIGIFSNSIAQEMCCRTGERNADYVFMCFLLGNDFMPHFPALNIRTHGINVLLDLYRKYIGKKLLPNRQGNIERLETNEQERFFICPQTNEIQWRWVRLFIGELSKREHELLMNEYEIREKWDTKYWPDKTDKEKEDCFQNIPVIYRGEEKYICPSEPFWEKRYYRVLFIPLCGEPPNNNSGLNEKMYKETSTIDSICHNYLEGLEWVYRYYTVGCRDWRWKYRYHYPPLFIDLYRNISHKQITYFPKLIDNAFTEEQQLKYVLPLGKMNPRFLSDSLKVHLRKNLNMYPNGRLEYRWTFCRYFWESHLVLPETEI